MEIKDLNKQQMVLLTLLICFVVSIATGIVTVSLMQKMPQTVPQTINRIIERTIQNVSNPDTTNTSTGDNIVSVSDNNAMVNIYSDFTSDGYDINATTQKEPTPLGQGVVVSDMGLIMIDSVLLNGFEIYTVKLDTKYFEAKILKKFGNGITLLQIIPKSSEVKKDTSGASNTTVDVKQ